jgi:hypothetical protein
MRGNVPELVKTQSVRANEFEVEIVKIYYVYAYYFFLFNHQLFCSVRLTVSFFIIIIVLFNHVSNFHSLFPCVEPLSSRCIVLQLHYTYCVY